MIGEPFYEKNGVILTKWYNHGWQVLVYDGKTSLNHLKMPIEIPSFSFNLAKGEEKKLLTVVLTTKS